MKYYILNIFVSVHVGQLDKYLHTVSPLFWKHYGEFFALLHCGLRSKVIPLLWHLNSKNILLVRAEHHIKLYYDVLKLSRKYIGLKILNPRFRHNTPCYMSLVIFEIHYKFTNHYYLRFFQIGNISLHNCFPFLHTIFPNFTSVIKLDP